MACLQPAEVFREISFAPGETYGPHSHHRLEINFVKRGGCSLTIATGSKTFRRGDIMVVPSEVRHYFEAGQRGATLIQLEFMPEWIDKVSSLWGNIYQPETGFLTDGGDTILVIRSDVRIKTLLQNIIWEIHNRPDGHMLMVVNLYAQLLILLGRAHAESAVIASRPPVMIRIMREIDRALSSHVTIDDIAHEVGITPRYMRRLFMTHLHTSPSRYLEARRVAKASEMTANTVLSATDIARSCGFSSTRQMTSAMRRHNIRL